MSGVSKKYEKEAFGLTILGSGHKDIRALKKKTEDATIHGNKVWKSSFILMDYLTEMPPEEGARILEVGCGWGLSGVFCAKTFNADVTSLDADMSVFPYLQLHAELNGVSVKTWCNKYEQISQKDLAEFDLVIAADVCFWDSMVDPLYNLIARAQQLGGVRVVMADPGRPTFREMAERCVDSFDVEYENWHLTPPHNTSGLILDVYPPQ